VWFQGNDPQKGTRHVTASTFFRRTTLERAALAMLLVAALLVGTAARGEATPPTTDRATATAYAAHWLAAQVTSDGDVLDAHGNPSTSNTLQTALALATAGHDQAAFDRAVSWLSAHVDDVTGTGVHIDAGVTGTLLMVVVAAGDDPTAFGGVDLVSRLEGTLGAFEPGLYGSYADVGDPTYSGVYDQSLAILGLKAAGVTESSAALDWLVAQQCTSSGSLTGAWMSYRPPATACHDFDSVTFTGVDTNSTAVALDALEAAGRTPAADALSWLAANQNADASFGFYVGNPGDPDSTALVVQAIEAGGESPAAGRWVKDGKNPVQALLSFQIGCDAAVADRGAFTFPGSGGAPSAIATEQAVWGTSGRTFPLGPITWSADATPCAVNPTTTTAPGSAPTSSAASNGTAVPLAVAAEPAFTG
jgi:hypothetical protein